MCEPIRLPSQKVTPRKNIAESRLSQYTAADEDVSICAEAGQSHQNGRVRMGAD